MNKTTLKATLSVALLSSAIALNALSTQKQPVKFENLNYDGVSTVKSRNYCLGKLQDTAARWTVISQKAFNNICDAGKNYVGKKIGRAPRVDEEGLTPYEIELLLSLEKRWFPNGIPPLKIDVEALF